MKEKKKPAFFSVLTNVIAIILIGGTSAIGWIYLTGDHIIAYFFGASIAAYITILVMKYYQYKYGDDR